jgi:hypothetical protein
MTETSFAPVTSDPSAARRRRAWPPWQVWLSFLLLFGGRFINSQLAFPTRMDVRISLFNTSFLFIPTTFWIWPPAMRENPARSASPWVRWGLLVVLWYFMPLALDVFPSPRGARVVSWLSIVLPCGTLSATLIYPFPRLFANLRLDRTIPASSALGPCALFFFYALMVPAFVQSQFVGSPVYLRWIMLIVPPVTAALLALDLRERRSANRGWHRELAGLLWKTALLPLLFLLGEAGMVLLLTHIE